jgi:hypothetical protein
VLAVDDPAAEVVRRIFAEYLDGLGDRAIANGLNGDRFRVRRPAIPPRIAIESPMDGREARCARYWRTPPVHRLRSLRPLDQNTNGFSTPMRWAPATSCGFVGPGPTRSWVHEDAHIAPSSPCRSSSTFSCWIAPVAAPASGSWNAGPGPTNPPYLLRGRIRCGFCLRRMEGNDAPDTYLLSLRGARHRSGRPCPGPASPDRLPARGRGCQPAERVAGRAVQRSQPRCDGGQPERIPGHRSGQEGRATASSGCRGSSAPASGGDRCRCRACRSRGGDQHRRSERPPGSNCSMRPHRFAMSEEDIYALIKSLGEIAPLLDIADPALDDRCFSRAGDAAWGLGPGGWLGAI